MFYHVHRAPASLAFGLLRRGQACQRLKAVSAPPPFRRHTARLAPLRSFEGRSPTGSTDVEASSIELIAARNRRIEAGAQRPTLRVMAFAVRPAAAVSASGITCDMGDRLPPLTQWKPAGEPRGCVQIVHGMAEHRGRYARFASLLATAGYEAWAHDHRGHGENAVMGKGHFADRDGWRALVSDTAAITQRIRAEHAATPVILFGHSMGSFIAQTLMTERAQDYAAIVLAGSNGRDPASHGVALVLALIERRLRGAREQSTWIPALLRRSFNRQFQPTRTVADWLSRDEREVDAVLADTLCGVGLTSQSWVDYARGLMALDALRRFRRVPASLPVLLMSGTRDPVGRNGRGPARLARALTSNGARDVTVLLYPEARHELLNETNRDRVTQDVIAWIDARCGPLSTATREQR